MFYFVSNDFMYNQFLYNTYYYSIEKLIELPQKEIVSYLTEL